MIDFEKNSIYIRIFFVYLLINFVFPQRIQILLIVLATTDNMFKCHGSRQKWIQLCMLTLDATIASISSDFHHQWYDIDFYFKTSINTFYEEIQVKIPTLLANMHTCLKVNSNRNIYTQPRNTLFKGIESLLQLIIHH